MRVMSLLLTSNWFVLVAGFSNLQLLFIVALPYVPLLKLAKLARYLAPIGRVGRRERDWRAAKLLKPLILLLGPGDSSVGLVSSPIHFIH